MRPDVAPVPMTLSPETAAFIQGGVSIRLASSTPARKPVSGRAIAASVSTDRRRITLFLDAAVCAPVLEAVRAGGIIAAAFTQPTTHRSLQLKGADATLHPPGPEALEVIERHLRAFTVELREIAFPDPFIAAHEAFDPQALVALTFSATNAFDQTPGPRAGDAVVP